MTTERDREHNGDPAGDLDPGAYIGHEPELESDSIPGGVSDRDERTSAYDSQPGVPGEPDANPGDEAAESTADPDVRPPIDA